MSNWALIINEVVAETTTVDPAGRYHESLEWVGCGAEVLPGWVRAGGTLSAPPPVPVTWDDLRPERDRRLADCDWTMIADAPLSTDERDAWKAYRQQLRELPSAQPDASAVVWPTPPGSPER